MTLPHRFLELFERLRDGDFSPREALQHLAARRRRQLGLRSLLNFDKRQLAADPVQSILDGGVADAKVLLHLFDRSMAADERRDEHLVLGWQLCQRRRRERTFDDHTRVDESYTVDLDSGCPDELRELLPISRHQKYVSI